MYKIFISLQKVLQDSINLDVAISFVGIYTGEALIHVFKEINIRMFI